MSSPPSSSSIKYVNRLTVASLPSTPSLKVHGVYRVLHAAPVVPVGGIAPESEYVRFPVLEQQNCRYKTVKFQTGAFSTAVRHTCL